MSEYTYEDIIMDPNDPRLEDAIGKECWLSDYPKEVLDYARNNLKEFRLKSIEKEENFPFVDNNHEDNWALIIIKKEEPKPKYVPFESKEEFIDAFHYHDNSKYSETDDILLNYGMWLKHRESDDLFMVVEIWDDGVVIGSNQFTTSWNDLSNDYTFLDGSPCRKEVEE